jgi:hypothetical protein
MIQADEPPPQLSSSSPPPLPTPGIGSLPTNLMKEEDAAEIHPRQEERDSSTTAARPNKKMRRLRPAASALRGQEDILKLIRSFLWPSAHPYSYKVRMDFDGLVEHVVVEALHDDGVEDNEEEQNDDIGDDDTDTDEEFDVKNNEEKESDIADDPQPAAHQPSASVEEVVDEKGDSGVDDQPAPSRLLDADEQFGEKGEDIVADQPLPLSSRNAEDEGEQEPDNEHDLYEQEADEEEEEEEEAEDDDDDDDDESFENQPTPACLYSVPIVCRYSRRAWMKESGVVDLVNDDGTFLNEVQLGERFYMHMDEQCHNCYRADVPPALLQRCCQAIRVQRLCAFRTSHDG